MLSTQKKNSQTVKKGAAHAKKVAEVAVVV